MFGLKRRQFFKSAIVIAAGSLMGCGGSSSAGPHKPTVVVTCSILGDLAKQVAGDRIPLTVLVGPDADTHSYEPTPTDASTIARADLVLENGLEFENWLDKLYSASGSKAVRVVVTRGVKALKMEEDVDPSKKDDQSRAVEKGETDPHAWHDVRNAIVMVQNVAEGLSKADPEDATYFDANAKAYVKELEALDAGVVEQVAALPAERRKLVTTHDALGYFARRYGFKVLGSGLNSLSTESGDPSAKELSEMIKRIKESGVPTIFLENIQNSKLMEQISSEAHVKIGRPLFTDALGKPGSEGDTYLKLVRYNVKAIVEGLK